MSEIHFIVDEAPEGGYVARVIGVDVVIEADDLPYLHARVRDAVHCHFDADKMPALIRLHITREEVLAKMSGNATLTRPTRWISWAT
jgi:hypothetical protein